MCLENNGIKQWLSLIDERVSAVFKSISSNFIRHKFAVVTAYDTESYIAYVIFEDDDNKTIHKYYNKSGEELSENDTVRIYYTINIDKGWIGARCGEPKPLSSGMDIDTAIIITPDQSKYMLEKYEVIHEAQGDLYCYGHETNSIYVNGYEFHNSGVENTNPTFYWSAKFYGSSTLTGEITEHIAELKLVSVRWSNNRLIYNYRMYINGQSARGYVSYHRPVSGMYFEWSTINAIYPTQDEIDNSVQTGDILSYGYITYYVKVITTLPLYDLDENDNIIYETTPTGYSALSGDSKYLHFTSKAERATALGLLNIEADRAYDEIGAVSS